MLNENQRLKVFDEDVPRRIFIIIIIIIKLYLFTAIGFALGGSSPTLAQTKTIKQHYTVVQHNTIKRKQHNTINANIK
jgi:hypothetical protein